MAVSGCFKERDVGHYFQYKTTTDPWALKHGLDCEYESEAGHVRFFKLKKTVVYVAVDENDDGSPKLEKWHVKRIWHKEQ
jgi:hypothetical protein